MTTELAVVTPTFGPDAELFAELHRSVLDHTPAGTVHHVVVPDVDRGAFAGYAGDRCRIWTASELLPRRFLALPRRAGWANLRRPWPPVRGWVMQQALKIALTGELDAGAVLLADSDVVLVRSLDVERSRPGRWPRTYRNDGAVHAGMTRHVRWHAVARRLLGLPPAAGLPLPDYVSPLNVWEPATVRALQRRVGEVTGRSWLDAFCAELHVSEFILYGVFVDEVLDGPAGAGTTLDVDFCHNYWETAPLDARAATSFAGRLPAGAVGMMISAKSGTGAVARAAAVRRCAELTR